MEVWHMSGAGNSFVVADGRFFTPDDRKNLQKHCIKLGCDGFMAASAAENADFRLDFYNRDGSRAGMCGNGLRCICRFAFEKGIARERMTVQTDAGLLTGRRLTEHRYRVQLPQPQNPQNFDSLTYVELGVPHAVVELPELHFFQKDRLRGQARQLRYSPAFPNGANVDYFSFLEPGLVRVLTFERGVEDFTLACGTGCGAVAYVLQSKGKLPGNRLTLQNEGGILAVDVQDTAIYLTGDTKIEGIWEL